MVLDDVFLEIECKMTMVGENSSNSEHMGDILINQFVESLYLNSRLIYEQLNQTILCILTKTIVFMF